MIGIAKAPVSPSAATIEVDHITNGFLRRGKPGNNKSWFT